MPTRKPVRMGVMGLLMLSVVAPAGAQATTSDCLPVVERALEEWASIRRGAGYPLHSEVFAEAGPQRSQLVAEVAADKPRSVEFEVLDLVVRDVSDATETVWAEVRISEVGHRSRVVGWDFDMVRVTDGCRVWTVVEAERPPASVPASTRVSSTTTSTAPNPNPSLAAATLPAATTNPGTVRLPAVVAWVIVLTLGGVACAGYLAPRFDGRRDS